MYYLNYFATYAGFVFITTWVFQFLKFDVIIELLGIEDINHLPFHGEFWGYTVLSEEQLLFRVVALSAMLVLSVIGYRAIKAQENDAPLIINANDTEGIQMMDESVLYSAVLKQREQIFWSTTSFFWPIINFIATFFHIPVLVVIVCQALYWKLSWTMLLFLFFAVGPWYSLDLEYLQTKNEGKEHPLGYYSNIAVQTQRLKKWKTLTWLCLLSWILIFPSEKILQLFDMKARTKTIFYGEWAGLIYPGTNHHLTFWNYVSGYMAILTVLVLEKKLLEWLENENSREQDRQYQQTVGAKDSHQNYQVLLKEIDRREEIEGLKPKKKKTETLVGFEGIDEEGKIEIKQRLKEVFKEDKESSKKKDRTKNPHPPYLKSAMKKSSRVNEQIENAAPKEESKRDEGPQGPRPYEEPMKDLDRERDTEDLEFNKLFTENDPQRNENRRLLLFQYRIKFMRGARIFTEE